MTLGLQELAGKRYRILRLNEGISADIAAPTTSDHGQAMPDDVQGMATERCVIALYNLGGTGTIAIGSWAKIFGYNDYIAKWFPLSSGQVDADRGKINGGLSLNEVASDEVRFVEIAYDLAMWDRIAIQTSGITGTDDTWNIDLIIPRRLARISAP